MARTVKSAWLSKMRLFVAMEDDNTTIKVFKSTYSASDGTGVTDNTSSVQSAMTHPNTPVGTITWTGDGTVSVTNPYFEIAGGGGADGMITFGTVGAANTTTNPSWYTADGAFTYTIIVGIKDSRGVNGIGSYSERGTSGSTLTLSPDTSNHPSLRREDASVLVAGTSTLSYSPAVTGLTMAATYERDTTNGCEIFYGLMGSALASEGTATTTMNGANVTQRIGAFDASSLWLGKWMYYAVIAGKESLATLQSIHKDPYAEFFEAGGGGGGVVKKITQQLIGV